MGLQMPPFKLKFQKENVKGSVFQGLKKVKAVVPIEMLNDRSDQFIMSQYLIYKLFEIYAPLAYKSRLIRLHIQDSSGQFAYEPKLMFFIEPNRNLEKRLNVLYIPFKIRERRNLDELNSSLDQKYALKVIAFNFFIRNFDSAVPGTFATLGLEYGQEGLFGFEKNTKMFKDAFGVYRPLAYDFDLAGANDFGTCMWESMHLMMRITSGDGKSRTPKPDSLCSAAWIKKSLAYSFEGHVHKAKLLIHRDHYLSSVQKWKKRYQEELSQLSVNHMKNFDMHLEALKQLR